MFHFPAKQAAAVIVCVAILAGCGQSRGISEDATTVASGRESKSGVTEGGSLLDSIFGDGDGNVKVNRYLWTASLDVLNFLPVESADPFTGVISTGYGTPPGGGRAYRATILISDPALDARSLNVALQTRRGPVGAGTQRAVEDAILGRARQLRINAERY